LPWVSSHGIVSSRQLHLLRSVSPSSSPFATRTGFPTQAGRCSLGFSSPLESSPSKPRSLVPARARRLEHACLPVGSRSLPTGSEPSRPGEVSPLPRKLGSTCSTGFSPLRDWPAPPLGGAPPLMTLERRAHPTSWPPEFLSARSAAFPPQRRLLFWGFLPLRRPRDFGSSPALAYRFAGRSSSRLRAPGRPSDL